MYKNLKKAIATVLLALPLIIAGSFGEGTQAAEKNPCAVKNPCAAKKESLCSKEPLRCEESMRREAEANKKGRHQGQLKADGEGRKIME